MPSSLPKPTTLSSRSIKYSGSTLGFRAGSSQNRELPSNKFTSRSDDDIQVTKLHNKRLSAHEETFNTFLTNSKDDCISGTIFDDAMFQERQNAYKSPNLLASDAYHGRSLAQFIKELIDVLQKWGETMDPRDKIPYVADIKKLLAEYKDILTQRDTSRLLYGTVSLIFNNGTWNKMSRPQIKGLAGAVSRLQGRELSASDIKGLHQWIYDAKIGILT